MRHRKNNVKFGRSNAHREALVSMLVVGLIKAKSIRSYLLTFYIPFTTHRFIL